MRGSNTDSIAEDTVYVSLPPDAAISIHCMHSKEEIEYVHSDMEMIFPSLTVLDVKKYLQCRKQYPVKNQRIVFPNREIPDYTLISTVTKNRNRLVLYIVLRNCYTYLMIHNVTNDQMVQVLVTMEMKIIDVKRWRCQNNGCKDPSYQRLMKWKGRIILGNGRLLQDCSIRKTR